MFGMTVLLILAAVAFLCVCLWILLRPGHFSTPRTVVCPETLRPVTVRVDFFHRLQTLLRGREALRLKACSRWPERQNCGEECRLQLDLSPEILDRILRNWVEGRQCAICHQALQDCDWRMGHFSGVDEAGVWTSTAQMPLQELPLALNRYRPVCWSCNLEQSLQREPVFLKGDRREPQEPMWDGY